MSQTILIKRSSVSGKAPTTAQLSLGELALNTYDGKIFLKKSVLGVDSIVEIGALSITGDATGSGNGSITLTLANSGVTAGTYPKVTVDAKGRVTSGSSLAASDIPALDWSKITSGKPTTLSGYGITDGLVTNGVYSGYLAIISNQNGSLSTLTSGDIGPEARGNGTGPALMTFHRPGSYAAYLGLDTDNQLKFGGWSAGTNAYGIPLVNNTTTPKDGDIKVASGVISIYASGAWKQVFPAVYA